MTRSGHTYQIQDPARDDEIVQPVHHLLHGGVQVPVVEVQDVDIRRPQLLQARLNAELEALEVVADVVDALLQLRVSGPEVVGVLARR